MSSNHVTIDDLYNLFLTGDYTLQNLVDHCKGKWSRTHISVKISERLKQRKQVTESNTLTHQ